MLDMAARHLLFLCLTAVLICLATGSSKAPNPLQFLAKVESPIIHKPSQKINPFSTFDLDFNLYQAETRVRLRLEPNHDVISKDAVVTFLEADGSTARFEPIDRKAHLIFKGSAYVQSNHGLWSKTGSARIIVHRDGPNPLFEGSFAINHDNHHIQLPSTYIRTKHPLDPELEDPENQEEMLVYRDSDVSSDPRGPYRHEELKRGEPVQGCVADLLSFNSRPDHPVFRNRLLSTDSSWGAMPFWSAVGKRQSDTPGSGGNSGGVDLSQTVGRSAGCPTTRKVALVGVATDCEYSGDFPNSQALRKHVISVMNQASGVWESTFNISLGLQNLTISPAQCPGREQKATPWNQDCSSSLQMQDRLNLFSAWRGGLDDSNSHWTLLTNCQYNGEVGLAWLGQACVNTAQTTPLQQGGNEIVSGANVVARTRNEWQVVAHETGHTFGAVHDCDSQTCTETEYVNSQSCCPLSGNTCNANAQYIMNPYTDGRQTTFSPCTLGNICSAIGRNSVSTSCLSVNKGISTITKHVCGNGIVEDGEDCDCGGEEGCAGDQCCDPNTCKYVNGAECDDANEDCCSGCRFSSSGTVCRPSTGSCDPAEKCTGKSAFCPKDVTAPNGQSCTMANVPSEAGDLTCASGQCTSRNLQCLTVMGAFTQKSNDTYACDDNTCLLSCGSPAFPANVCYSLRQNMLDGTPCGGGGHCQNGRCEGSQFGKEIASWISDHKAIVIGVAVGVGVLLLIILTSCVCGCIRRRKRQEQMLTKIGPRPASGWYGPPVPPHQAPPPWLGGMVQSTGPNPPNPATDHAAQQGWRPPQHPLPQQPQPPSPSGLYGGGIIGSRGPEARQTPFLQPPAYSHYPGSGQDWVSPRYA